MIRRLALAACAVLTTTSLASCATFSDNDAVARVGDRELLRDDVAALFNAVFEDSKHDLDATSTTSADPAIEVVENTIPDTVDGEQMRGLVSNWIVHEAARQLLESEGVTIGEDAIATERQSLADGLTDGQTVPDIVLDYQAEQNVIEQEFQQRTGTTSIEQFVADADIYVDPLYGAWDLEQFAVVPLGG